eukprot:UN23798
MRDGTGWVHNFNPETYKNDTILEVSGYRDAQQQDDEKSESSDEEDFSNMGIIERIRAERARQRRRRKRNDRSHTRQSVPFAILRQLNLLPEPEVEAQSERARQRTVFETLQDCVPGLDVSLCLLIARME